MDIPQKQFFPSSFSFFWFCKYFCWGKWKSYKKRVDKKNEFSLLQKRITKRYKFRFVHCTRDFILFTQFLGPVLEQPSSYEYFVPVDSCQKKCRESKILVSWKNRIREHWCILWSARSIRLFSPKTITYHIASFFLPSFFRAKFYFNCLQFNK